MLQLTRAPSALLTIGDDLSRPPAQDRTGTSAARVNAWRYRCAAGERRSPVLGACRRDSVVARRSASTSDTSPLIIVCRAKGQITQAG